MDCNGRDCSIPVWKEIPGSASSSKSTSFLFSRHASTLATGTLSGTLTLDPGTLSMSAATTPAPWPHASCTSAGKTRKTNRPPRGCENHRGASAMATKRTPRSGQNWKMWVSVRLWGTRDCAGSRYSTRYGTTLRTTVIGSPAPTATGATQSKTVSRFEGSDRDPSPR